MSDSHYQYHLSGISVDHRCFDSKRVINYMHSHNTYVYQECGFNDYTAFYRSYVKFFGCSPSQQTEQLP